MKNFSYFLLAFVILGSVGCKKDDGPYFVTKELTVVALQENGEPMPFAEFSLFESHNDWRKNSNAIVKAITGKDGQFIYQDDNFEYGKKYYFDLGLEIANNWKRLKDGNITDEFYTFVFPDEPRRIRRDITVGAETGGTLSETYFDVFVGDSAFTTWELYKITINNIIQDWDKIDSCLKDNKLIFYKDFEMVISEGELVCSGKKSEIYSQYLPATPQYSTIDIANWPDVYDNSGEVDLVGNLSEIVVQFTKGGNTHMHLYKKKQ